MTMPRKRANRKTVRRPKGVTATSRRHCRTVFPKMKSGRETAENSRSKPPSTLPAQPKASVFQIMKQSSPAAAAATPATAGWTSRGPGGRTGRRTRCGRTCAPLRRPSSPDMMRTRRIAVDIRPRMVIVSTRRAGRRRRWGRNHWAPRVANDRVLHNDRLVRGRLNARAVTVGANRRPVGMGHDLHAVADRAKRTIDVTAVDPCSGRHAPSCENQRRSRQNRQIVLVHNAPRFPFTESKANEIPKSDKAKGPRKPRPLVHSPK